MERVLYLSPRQRSSCLIDSFSKQCSNLSVSQVAVLPRPISQGEEFVLAGISEEQEVSSALKNLNTWKVTRMDGLSTEILQASAVELATPLAFLFNVSLSKGV